jgi:lipid-binding SYLF domain-containing protein
MNTITKVHIQKHLFITLWLALGSLLFVSQTSAASAQELNIKSDATLKQFITEVTGGAEFLKKAKGVLVFPSVLKAGFGIGGEYGEGVLRIDGKTAEYYSTASASIGLQFGAQSKSIVIVFLKKKALDNFRTSDGWKAGVDGSVAVLKWGVGEDINSIEVNKPIVGFVFSNKGFMYNLTLEGSKFTKIKR